MPDLDFPIHFEGPAVPWFANLSFRRVHKGKDYNARCIAVIGPHDFSRVLFRVTSNPRQLQWSLDRDSDVPLIAHEAWWSIAQGTPKVHAELMKLVQPVDGWVTIPREKLLPMLTLASKRAGVPSRSQRDFEAWVLEQETAKLRARLAKTGLSPAIVAAHYYV